MNALAVKGLCKRYPAFSLENVSFSVPEGAVMGFIGRKIAKINYFTLMGLIAGSNTDPPALAFANQTAGNDAPAVGYSTVYPLSMFLRILTAQLIILLLCTL